MKVTPCLNAFIFIIPASVALPPRVFRLEGIDSRQMALLRLVDNEQRAVLCGKRDEVLAFGRVLEEAARVDPYALLSLGGSGLAWEASGPLSHVLRQVPEGVGEAAYLEVSLAENPELQRLIRRQSGEDRSEVLRARQAPINVSLRP